MNSGGSLAIGNGGSATLIGGSTSANSQDGAGTLTINGGTVTVAAAGAGGSSNDASSLWLNPYGTSATSTLNLDGGVLSTARPISPGSGTAAQAVVNLNGGLLQAAVASVNFINGGTVNVRNGGARIDTQAFNITIVPGLLHSGVGGDAAIDGGLVKTGSGALTLGAAGTFTGDVDINGGKLTSPVAANTATPTASGLGNLMTPGRQIRVNAGATLEFTNNDPLGAATVLQNTSLIVDGGTVDRTARFVTLPNVTLRNGATLTGANGVNANFQSYNLLGTVTVSGSSGSVITTTGASFTGIHLGGNITFDVGASSPLTVTAPLINKVNGTGAGNLAKTGAGVMTLAGANTYTGSTAVQDGALLVNGVHTGGGLITVSATATLGGGGQVGAVDFFTAGTLAPGDAARSDNWLQTAALSLGDAATQLNFELGAPDDGGPSLAANDLVTVSGLPYLRGVLNVVPQAGFASAPAGSKWRLFDLTAGTVPSDHELTLGAGVSSGYAIQAVAGKPPCTWSPCPRRGRPVSCSSG
ncbi:MAG: autotransporter-associated beta strand repeat-containing protein [Kiritimatiellia bacterium]